jgi:hypothetical protein
VFATGKPSSLVKCLRVRQELTQWGTLQALHSREGSWPSHKT